jgi:hypothetical protein
LAAHPVAHTSLPACPFKPALIAHLRQMVPTVMADAAHAGGRLTVIHASLPMTVPVRRISQVMPTKYKKKKDPKRVAAGSARLTTAARKAAVAEAARLQVEENPTAARKAAVAEAARLQVEENAERLESADLAWIPVRVQSEVPSDIELILTAFEAMAHGDESHYEALTAVISATLSDTSFFRDLRSGIQFAQWDAICDPFRFIDAMDRFHDSLAREYAREPWWSEEEKAEKEAEALVQMEAFNEWADEAVMAANTAAMGAEAAGEVKALTQAVVAEMVAANTAAMGAEAAVDVKALTQAAVAEMETAAEAQSVKDADVSSERSYGTYSDHYLGDAGYDRGFNDCDFEWGQSEYDSDGQRA